MSQMRHKNLVALEAVLCQRRKEGVSVYILQDFIHGTSVNAISNSLGWTHAGVSIIAKGVLEALIYLHNCGISHSHLDDSTVFMDNMGTCRVGDYSLPSYMCYLNGTIIRKEGDLPALGSLIESLVPLPNSNMLEFIEQCKSERTLTASDLLEHPFLLSERHTERESQPIVVPEKKIKSVPVLPMGTELRIETEFEVISWLGEGAYGDVLKVKNILDNRQYAIKRIPLISRSRQIFKKMTREVQLLSQLNHENVVRYFNSWIEWSEEADLKKYSSTENADESPSSIESASLLSVVSKNGETSSNWLGTA